MTAKITPETLRSLRLLANRAEGEIRHAVIEPDILHALLDIAMYQELTQNQRRVFSELSLVAGARLQVQLSIVDLSYSLDIVHASVRDALKGLEDAGWIRRTHRGVRGAPSTYEILKSTRN